jgi:N-acetylmuramoyl-L-alanine amidase
VPAVIIETHNAWHPVEAARWDQEATRRALATALAAALADVLR